MTKPFLFQGAGKGYITALLSILLISIAQLAMKWGVENLDLNLLILNDFKTIHSFTLVHWRELVMLSIGLICYALSMAFWVITLKTISLSIAYPMLSLSYILVYSSSIILPWINEAFSYNKLLGIISILIGLVLIFSAKKTLRQADGV